MPSGTSRLDPDINGLQLFQGFCVSSGMSETAMCFRKRARDCRALAWSARNPADRSTLEEIAEELDEEANKIDAEEAEHSTDKTTGG